MKVNLLITMIVFALIWPAAELRAAVSKITWADVLAREFVFVENNPDGNFFVIPGGTLDPRLTGANRWTGLKYIGLGTTYQQSLSYIDNGYNTGLYTNWKFDMWLENSPVPSPLTGLHCINWYAGCSMTTNLIPSQTTDASGFYGATVTNGGTKWMHGMLLDAFYQYLQQMPVGSSFTMTISACQISVNHDASSGARCKDQASGNWYVRNATHTKIANLRLINTHSLAEVFTSNDGVLTLDEGNVDCRTQTIGSLSGLSCKMVNYTLQINGLGNTPIHIFSVTANLLLILAVGAYDIQFSLNGSSWKPVSNTAHYYTFNEMKGVDSIYVFFSSNFFKQMVNLGINDINIKDLFNSRLQNATSPESGWYELSTSNTLIIKPRDLSISIISDEYIQAPPREGYVGSGGSASDLGYTVTTNSKTAADEVLTKVTGPTQVIGGRSYCVFSSDDDKAKVSFPATLSFITHNGATKIYDAGCDDSWRDMTDALWLITPWTDISGEVGQMDKTTVKFSVPMDNATPPRTTDDNGWFGEAGASEKIYVQATWRNIN